MSAPTRINYVRTNIRGIAINTAKKGKIHSHTINRKGGREINDIKINALLPDI